MSQGDLRVRAAVLCNEVRREYNGDAILLGVSPIGPEVDSEGSTIDRLGFYLDVETSRFGKIEVRIRSEESDIEILTADYDIPKPEDPPDGASGTGFLFVMVKNAANVEVQEPGVYLLQLRAEPSEDWVTATEVYFPESKP